MKGFYAVVPEYEIFSLKKKKIYISSLTKAFGLWSKFTLLFLVLITLVPYNPKTTESFGNLLGKLLSHSIGQGKLQSRL